MNNAKEIFAGLRKGIWAPTYTASGRYEPFYSRVMSHLQEIGSRDVTIVDVGCATGEPVEHLRGYLASYGYSTRVIGIDYNEEALAHAYGSGRVDRAVRAIGQWLPLRDKSADIVICHGIIYYLKSRSEIRRELVRVSKDGRVYTEHDIPEYYLDEPFTFYYDPSRDE